MIIDDIQHIASEMSDKDWDDLRFKKVYREAFIEGAMYILTQTKKDPLELKESRIAI